MTRLRLQDTGRIFHWPLATFNAQRTAIIYELHENGLHKVVSFSLLFADITELYVAVQLSGFLLTRSFERSV